MSEVYLPTRDSLGYQNVKQALEKIFSINLDTITINERDDENFNFPFMYNGYHMTIGISSTGKNTHWKPERVAYLTFGSLELMNRDFQSLFYPRLLMIRV